MSNRAFTVLAISITSFILAVFACVYWNYSFDKNCGDYLKLAGDAPNIERADNFLDKAIRYIERENLTSGNSAIIFSKPSNDVGVWYEQIKGAKETTENLLAKEKVDPASVSQLDKDNALMKIREVLLDDSSSGTKVTAPDWISWYPHQHAIAGWWIMAGIVFCIGLYFKTND
ncbi:MAG: hypothetical protein UY41_C0024G0007 [Candidatus Moranbacteria bacterium GW2011_GWE1_49_15]|nr:MAG: hypothetical protein UX75_C0011G0012 [Candidatus Moranbacteria bacterium GW2011_GWE2_47_10]KKW06478.1 MAG: hypothetical protein UY41_C0024G0007 [Candidatus Moranbacteria bacterium GW2011_GWE1_49_15]